MPPKHNPPGGESQGADKSINGSSISSLIPVTDPLDDIAAHVNGTFVVVVRAQGLWYRRRCFLSVSAAQKAARNAAERGYTVEVFLAELKPLWRLDAES
jgi:hypothetical protein